jgi:flagellar biosynthesis protein FlhA
MGGDFLIGIIVFLILVTINFLVITKGATRIAEVGARFTLDAIPGKQMAIDADLSAGLIDEKVAQGRRRGTRCSAATRRSSISSAAIRMRSFSRPS